ncbi:hypothetical protein GOV13_02795 [Candidatus Pacearchaeota archaeon]|nr:hypothetical protein [Candidatus Pacearchaeota archaeon]
MTRFRHFPLKVLSRNRVEQILACIKAQIKREKDLDERRKLLDLAGIFNTHLRGVWK